MIVRFALVGLAVASLTSPVRANETPSGTAQTQSEIDTGDVAAPVKHRRHVRARRARPVQAAEAPAEAALPNPADAGAAPTADVASDDSEPAETPVTRRVRHHAPKHKAASLLPPARPAELASLDQAAPADPNMPAAEPAAAPLPAETATKTPTFVSIMPPLRPAFEADHAGSELASNEPTPIVVTPDGTGKQMGKIVYVLPPARPGFTWDEDNGAALPGEVTAAEAAVAPAQPTGFASLFEPSTPSLTATVPATPSFSGRNHNGLDSMIAEHARINGIPVELVHRVVIRESKYNPGAVGHGGALGLMQIKHATARALGYVGSASGLLDANTNLTYAVKYLAGAYRTAGGNFDRAVSYYARGYYYAAKQLGSFRTADRRRGQQQAFSRGEDGASN
jgi:hypothetical protein